MNNKTPITNSDKHRQVIQQQLRAMANSRSASSSNKVLSADSMIEDLLSKKETFQRKNSKNSHNVPPWMVPGSGCVHPLYERVWMGVQSNTPHLADTPRLSTLLMTSGLSTDVLGFIWSLTNHTVVGAVTQQELYAVLALVALAQSGYTITTTAVLNQLPQPPLPKLDFTVMSLPTISSITTPSMSVTALNAYVSQQSVTPVANIAPLSASSLLDTKPITNCISPAIPPAINPSTIQGSVSALEHINIGTVPQTQKEIGISYVSNHMLPGQISQPQVSFVGLRPNTYPGMENVNFNDNQINALNGSCTISGLYGSSESSYKMSPDMLSSKLNTLSVQNNDSVHKTDIFDDDFTDFQTADFKMQKVQDPVNLDDDEFSNFQSVPISSNLLTNESEIEENNRKEVQKELTAPPSKIPDSVSDTNIKDISFVALAKPPSYSDTLISKQKTESSSLSSSKDKMAATFQETVSNKSDDRYSIFHNPLPELLEDRYSVFASLSSEDEMNFSNFIKAEEKTDSLPSVLELPKIQPVDSTPTSAGDDEYSDFHSFDFTTENSKTETQEDQEPNNFSLPNQARLNTVDNEFNVFNTLEKPLGSARNTYESKLTDVQFDLFQQNASFESFKQEPVTKDEQFADFESELFKKSADNLNIKLESTSETFSPFFSAESTSTTENLNLTKDNLQDQAENKFQNNFNVESVEDKYSALRVLEPVSEDTADDFGEFVEANTSSIMDKLLDETIQLRCLEACLTLLEAGVTNLSAASNPEILSQVLSDPRTVHYLDCLQEVNKVSERILTNIDTSLVNEQKTNLEDVREKLAPYFAYSQHSTMEETKGAVCQLCRSDTGPCPIKYGLCTFHAPCANLYLHCIDSVLPNIASVM